jgi:hypothetical protein
METAQHRARLAKNQPAEIAMFQISEVQESPAFNGRLSFLTLRGRQFGHRALTILRRIGLLIWRNQLNCRNPPRRNCSAEYEFEFG